MKTRLLARCLPLLLIVGLGLAGHVHASKKTEAGSHLVQQAEQARFAGNHAESVRLLQQAVEMGNSAAMTDLGLAYQRGRGIEQDYQKAFALFEQAAKKGHDYGMLNAGLAYRYGRGVEQNEKNAKRWLKKVGGMKSSRAAPSAKVELKKPTPPPGTFYDSQGRIAFDNQDYQKALDYWQQGAAAGNPHSMSWLGTMYWNGQGVVQSHNQAREWYLKAAKAGDKDGMFNLGQLYRYGMGTAVNNKEAVKWYKKAAKAGHKGADAAMKQAVTVSLDSPQSLRNKADQAWMSADYATAVAAWQELGNALDGLGFYNRAHALLNGWGVEKNERQVYELFRLAARLNHPGALFFLNQAADNGDVDSMLFLADLYLNSERVPYDGWRARELYRLAAYNGSQQAEQQLNRLSPVPDRNGQQEFDQASKASGDSNRFNGYLRAAQKGHAKAMAFVADMYMNGKGISANDEKARLWFSRAAAAGNLYGMQNYAAYLAQGIGGPQDGEAALVWYRMAADQGHSMSMWGLAMMYSHGMGIPKDDNQAVYWLEVAAAHGSARAEQSLIKRGLRPDIWAQRAAQAKALAEQNRRQQQQNQSAYFSNLARIWAYHNAPSGAINSHNSSDDEFWQRSRARSECMKKVSQSIQRQTYGQQTWRYVDNCN